MREAISIEETETIPMVPSRLQIGPLLRKL